MPKGSPELTAARKEEIVAACEKLYQTMSFKAMTIQDIANFTSFTRPSIYNYFETKEEIFLALLQKEYVRWTDDLEAVMSGHDALTRDEVAQALAHSLERREQLLKLMSMNNYDMETNSRMERLTEFKVAFGNSIKTVDRMLQKFCPEMRLENRQNFIYAFFPFIYGIYPYCVVSEKQKEAMDAADVGYVYHSIYELAYPCAKKLLEAEH